MNICTMNLIIINECKNFILHKFPYNRHLPRIFLFGIFVLIFIQFLLSSRKSGYIFRWEKTYPHQWDALDILDEVFSFLLHHFLIVVEEEREILDFHLDLPLPFPVELLIVEFIEFLEVLHHFITHQGRLPHLRYKVRFQLLKAFSIPLRVYLNNLCKWDFHVLEGESSAPFYPEITQLMQILFKVILYVLILNYLLRLRGDTELRLVMQDILVPVLHTLFNHHRELFLCDWVLYPHTVAEVQIEYYVVFDFF